MTWSRSVPPQGRRTPASAGKRPTELPGAQALIEALLDQAARGGVPIRRSFIQRPEPGDDGTRGAVLAQLVRSRDVSALDAYLLIHAIASSSPWEVQLAVPVWARALGFDQHASGSAARAHWAKVASKLVRLGLIDRRRAGNRVVYRLLDESGGGEDYTRPKVAADGAWFSLPHAYWTEEHYRTLTLAEKAMLLILIDQRARFALSHDAAYRWYGISPATAKRGLRDLEHRRLIEVEINWRVEPKSPTGWIEVRRYTPLGAFAPDARKKAMSTRPKKAAPVYFRDEGDE